ncbi:uncharacterized protein [Pocillopora verrucosa]|uniref:uncharacterized protein n=1 Tax=Pocillopora verrucosa TaxID=203993 RepID=UPI0033422913
MVFAGKRLVNHRIRIIEVMEKRFCRALCFMEPDCVSINLDKRVDGSGNYKCELNNVTHEGHEHELREEENSFYHAAKSACVKNFCKNNATCQSGFNDKGYRCLCTAGFKGRHCDQDVDECSSGFHSCSADAVCNNTKGSYYCTCKPGYSGDGWSCNDINECIEGISNCSIDAVCNNTKGSYNCTCRPGYSGNGQTCKGPSFYTCKEIFKSQRSTKSQVYPLMFGSQNVPVYCHMGSFGCGDGGWTLAMKIDGKKKTFHYDSKFWSDKNVFNLPGGKTGFDSEETKLPTYWNTPFSKICLGMKINQQLRFIVINKQASSLHSLIADGKYRNTALGRKTWKKLIGSQSSLQANCNKEGFNAAGSSKGSSKARIGILGNNEKHCATTDSRIGFGTGGYQDDTITCGNDAIKGHTSDNGEKHIKAMGYILVQ